MTPDIRALWAGETRLAKASLILAALSAILAFASWLPRASFADWIIYPLHGAMMILMGSVFVVVAWRNLVALFRQTTHVTAKPLPRAYWICLGGALLYFLAVFIGYALSLPRRTPLGPTIGLRIATSAYLLLSLGSFGLVRAHRELQATDKTHRG